MNLKNMKASKTTFLLFALLICSMSATAQERLQVNNIDSVRVLLQDFSSSTYFNYCYTTNRILIFGEKTIDSIAKPGRMDPYKRYHEHKELRWEVLTPDTITRFVNYAISFVTDDVGHTWISECDGNGYETEKMHMDVFVYLKEDQLWRSIVFEPNCRYESFINEYISFIKRLGWL